jgi:phage gp45-like
MRRPTIASLRARSGGSPEGKTQQAVRNLARRFRVATTAFATWVLEGFEDDDGNMEEEHAETFQGIGLYSKPAAEDRAEVIVIKVGADSEHGVAVGFRNVDALKRHIAEFGDIDAGDTAVFNSGGTARVLLRNEDGFAVVDGEEILLGRTATQALLKGTAYASAEATMLTALSAFISSVNAGSTSDVGVAKAAAVAALAAFSPASHLSTRSKTE